MGIFFGFIGRIKCPVIDDCILLVKESVLVGELPSGHAVHKIKSIAMFNPTSEVIFLIQVPANRIETIHCLVKAIFMYRSHATSNPNSWIFFLLYNICSYVQIWLDLGLKPCSKHHRAAYDMYEQNLSNSAISKTWSSLKTATTNIKSSTQNTATPPQVIWILFPIFHDVEVVPLIHVRKSVPESKP